jgi:hypothetical protein
LKDVFKSVNRAKHIANKLIGSEQPIDVKKFITGIRDRRGPGKVQLDSGLLVTDVISRDGEHGAPTGGIRPCRMEGCTGIRFGVRWPDGKITWICSRGVEFNGTTATLI